MKKITVDDPLAASVNVVAENIEHIKSLFPEAFAEGKIDFACCERLLNNHTAFASSRESR